MCLLKSLKGLLKFFGFCDETGAKNPIPLLKTFVEKSSATINRTDSKDRQRPSSAPEHVLISDTDIQNHFSNSFQGHS